jgi:hypothetical protein
VGVSIPETAEGALLGAQGGGCLLLWRLARVEV